jgi:hypothetical protein
MFNWTQKEVVHIGGPGVPPPGFVGGQNSASEWVWYWASFKATSPNLDPRLSGPPFYGNDVFGYQKAELGSHTRALGSAVADFLYRLGSTLLIVRLQSAFFHLMAPAAKQALDSIQLVNLLGMQAGANTVDVVDIYEQSFLGDETGQAAVILCKETLGLIRHVDPLSAGVARVVRNPAATAGQPV